MPPILDARLLFDAIITGAALGASLALGTAAARLARIGLSARRARAERQVRRMVLAAVNGAAAAPELIAARGARGRAADRLLFAYLTLVRGEAATFLADVLKHRGTLDRILRGTHSSRARRRARAAERLGLIASLEAERRLSELVTGDQSAEVRIVATRSLGKTGSPAAAVTLLHSLSRPAPVPEEVVASALLELGPEAVPALREELAGGRRQRAMAASVLGLLEELPAWPGLVENALAGSLEVRASAIRALGRLGLPQTIGPVTACLAPSEDPELRAAAAHALGQIGDPRSAGPLADCLEDPDYWVAHFAAAALAELGGAGVAELKLAAGGLGSAAAHAREVLARRTPARTEPRAASARTAGVAAQPAQPARHGNR